MWPSLKINCSSETAQCYGFYDGRVHKNKVWYDVFDYYIHGYIYIYIPWHTFFDSYYLGTQLYIKYFVNIFLQGI